MKLAQLISQAQAILDRQGDIEVFMETPDDEHEIERLEAFELKTTSQPMWLCAIKAEGCDE